jgi:hypothetical protein
MGRRRLFQEALALQRLRVLQRGVGRSASKTSGDVLLMKYFMLEGLTAGFSRFLLHLLHTSSPALVPNPDKLQPVLP